MSNRKKERRKRTDWAKIGWSIIAACLLAYAHGLLTTIGWYHNVALGIAVAIFVTMLIISAIQDGIRGAVMLIVALFMGCLGRLCD